MKQLSLLPDERLVQLYKANRDAATIGEIYKRYSVPVFGLCYKYLKDENNAKDAVSEIFELILEKLKTHEVTFFGSWLFIVTKHYLLRRKEKKPPADIICFENIQEKFMEKEQDGSLNIWEQKDALLHKAVNSLNEDQRTCIELFYLRRKPYQEVAVITGYDIGKVKSCIQNGKRNLRLFIEEKIQLYE